MVWASKAWTPFVSRQGLCLHYKYSRLQSSKGSVLLGTSEPRVCKRWVTVIKAPMQVSNKTVRRGAELKAQGGEATGAALASLVEIPSCPTLSRECFTGSAASRTGTSSSHLSSKAAAEESPPLPQHEQLCQGGSEKLSTSKGRELETGNGWKLEKGAPFTAALASDQAPAMPPAGFIQRKAEIKFLLRHRTLRRN